MMGERNIERETGAGERMSDRDGRERQGWERERERERQGRKRKNYKH